MPRIGVRDLFAAELDELTDIINGETPPDYDKPFRISKAINITLTPQLAEANLFADDSQSDYQSNQTAVDLGLNIRDITPEIEAKLFGKKTDSRGGVSTTSRDRPPLFAVMFRSERSDGLFEYRVLYKVRFRVFDETHATKGESITYQTPTINGRSMRRDYDERFDYKLVGTEENEEVVAKWFDEVIEPAANVD